MSAPTPSGKLRQRVMTLVFMFAVTLVSISAVSAIYLYTADIVKQNEALFMKRAVLEAGGLDEAAADRVQAQSVFSNRVQTVTGPDGKPYYRILDPANGQAAGYAFVREGAGLWGTIRGVVGLDGELKAFTGVTFVEQNETPGLGARIVEDWFKRQFRGKTGPFDIVEEGTRSAAPTEFDGITGATISTRAVRDMLNATLKDAPGLVRAGA